MGRRRDDRILDDLFDVVAMAPWWVGLILAIASYLVLHRYATAEIGVAASSVKLGEAMTNSLLKGFAIVLQYILPVVFLAAAIASGIKQFQRSKLVSKVAVAESRSVLAAMTWQQFELLVAEAFRLDGFTVVERERGGADGGIDLVLRKGSEKHLVQCKQWRAQKVGVSVVRELFGVMAAEHAAGGYVITSGEFTEDATAFAHGRNIFLLNGDKLFKMFDHVRAARTAASNPAAPAKVSVETATPSCPKCGKTMVQRTALQGSNAGKKFWGCPSFPHCRGVRQIG